MLTLCIDTAFKYLTCALIKDERIIASYSKECFKKQSEEVFSVLNLIFDEAKIDRREYDLRFVNQNYLLHQKAILAYV